MVRYRHSEQVYNVPGSSEDALGLEFGDLALEMLVGLKMKKVIVEDIVHLKIIFGLNFLRSRIFRIVCQHIAFDRKGTDISESLNF